MAPPFSSAEFPLKVELVAINVVTYKHIAPPPYPYNAFAVLFIKAQLLVIKVPP